MKAPTVQHVTPWFDRKEWQIVYEKLYSKSKEDRHFALDKLSLWKCRVGSKAATAIVCCHELTSAMLLLEEPEVNIDVFRSTVSMALIRFINLLTERNQFGSHAKPIHLLAYNMGLPDWLVDIRHDCTHGKMPSSRLMIEGARFALEWLRVNYWEGQLTNIEHILAPIDKDSVKRQVEKILFQYMQYQFNYILDEVEGLPETNDKELITILGDFCETAKKDIPSMLEILTGTGYLLITTEQMEALQLEEKHFTGENPLQLPLQLIELWNPLIRCINRMQYTVELLERLAIIQSQPNSFEEKLCMGWIYVIIEVHLNKLQNKKSDFIPTSNTEEYKLKVDDLIVRLVDNPNKFTACLLNHIFPLCEEYSNKQKEQLIELVETINGQKTKRSVENTTIYTLKDVDKLLEQSSVKKMSSENSSKKDSEKISSWTPCSDNIHWNQYPIGTCPGYIDGDVFTLGIQNLSTSALTEPIENNTEEPMMFDDHIDVYNDEKQDEMQIIHTDQTLWSENEMNRIKDQLILF